MRISRREFSSSVRKCCTQIFIRFFDGLFKYLIRDILSRVKDEIAAKEAEISELEKSMNEGLSLVENVAEYENEFNSQVWLLNFFWLFLEQFRSGTRTNPDIFWKFQFSGW